MITFKIGDIILKSGKVFRVTARRVTEEMSRNDESVTSIEHYQLNFGIDWYTSEKFSKLKVGK